MFNQTEAINDLKASILRLRKQPADHHKDNQALEADILWDASRFLAEVIKEGTATKNDRTVRQLQDYVNHHKQETGIDIDISDLFKRNWLRCELGIVRVPQAIHAAASLLGKISAYRNELKFVTQFYRARSDRQKIKVPITMVETAAAEYEKENQVKLDRNGIFNERWARKEDEQVEISAMDLYFEPILSYWDELVFIFEWRQTYCQAEDKGVLISKQAFEQIHHRFSHFKDLPAIPIFFDQRVLYAEGEDYYANFRLSEPRYWSALEDKTAGHYWQMLLGDEKFADDKQRVKVWLNGILSQNGWPDHLIFVTVAAKQRFLAAAMELLLEETDVDGCGEEFDKVLLDSREYRGAEALYMKNVRFFEGYKLNDSNLFELYGSLSSWEAESQRTYLYDQPARLYLAYLINTIVWHEPEYTRHEDGGITPIARIFTLLRTGISKPYYLWKTAESIIHWRPEIIPHLLTQGDLCTLGLSLLDNLEFSYDEAASRQQVWSKAVGLLLQCLPPAAGNESSIAAIVFQLFRQLNKDKYVVSHVPRGKRASGQEGQQRAGHEAAILGLIENAPLHIGQLYGSMGEFLIPVIFTQLAEQFLRYEEQLLYKNGVIRFPVVKWDGMFWLLRLASNWKYRTYFSKAPEKVTPLIESFLNEYLNNMEVHEVTIYDYREKKDSKTIPLWAEKIERLSLLDWIHPIYGIHSLRRLNSFLEPRLHFVKTTELFHKQNNFTADKLRTHIGVMLQILRKLAVPELPYGYEKATLLEIKKRIETKVVDYLHLYTRDKPEEGYIDLLSYHKERAIEGFENEALLPQLAQAINWFADKESIIGVLLSTGDPVKLLTLLDYIAVEGIRKSILDAIKATDIMGYLDNSRWIPEIEAVLVKISRYSELLSQLEQAIKFWKDNVVEERKQQQYERQLFISELLVAYFKKDITSLEAVQDSGTFHGATNELNYWGIKQFYKGLLLMEDYPESAVTIFSELARRYPAYPSIALNRMVARINQGKRGNDTEIFEIAYEEWMDHAGRYFSSTELATWEPDVSNAVMAILLALSRHEEVDQTFKKLSLPVKMNADIVEVMVNSLVAQRKTAEALHLVESAKIYHQFSGYSQIQFLDELEQLVSGVDNVEELRMHYQQIFRSSPAKLIGILPDAFNGKADLHQFLVKEIVHASGKLLEKVKSIDEIDNEDKYNDLIELVLDARLNTLGWHVGSQSRGAFSAGDHDKPGSQPGERDLPIFDSNKKMMLVCEALIYRGRTNVAPHLKKVFNYHHQRQAFVVLCYDNATIKKGFDGNWREYIDDVVPGVVFPTGMEIDGPVVDITNDYEAEASAIKVAKSLHGQNTIVYHVFVNIHYHLR